jgi:hypothetical protein
LTHIGNFCGIILEISFIFENGIKSDFRLSRNLLKGQVGDEINVLMAVVLLR